MADELFLIWLRPVYPASVNLIPVMAGLLTRPGHRAFPVLHQWQKFDVRFCGLTAAGTVPDFHRIPFSFRGDLLPPKPFPIAKVNKFIEC